MGIDQGLAARELRQLAHERARAVGHDRRARAALMALGHVDGTGKNDVEPVTNLADPLQGSAGGKRTHLAEPPQPFDFGRLQARKHLVLPGIDNRLSAGHCWSRICAFRLTRMTMESEEHTSELQSLRHLV